LSGQHKMARGAGCNKRGFAEVEKTKGKIEMLGRSFGGLGGGKKKVLVCTTRNHGCDRSRKKARRKESIPAERKKCGLAGGAGTGPPDLSSKKEKGISE